ncbi:MAG: Acetyl-CoA acetyltransferase [Candidatus Scalindua rubra]|uniref:Acetyl-CoA acetyltransferase n=1 Tax=Candidatus Scalindua rubra TaxID=1872076 RepID=A0A1E3X8L0_9BACT|nr:MAG: Acetyl-CoA acetyltransferase [Candidatus Scalindua rubra]
MKNVVIVSACRSPVGKLQGQLSSLTAPQLCSKVIEHVLKLSKVETSQVDEVILGNVISAGIGQSPARQAALSGGLPDTVAALTINKVCASGLKAVALGAQAISLDEAEIVITGGMESMSNAPFLLKEMRNGKKLGDSKVIDSLIFDGLWDCYNNAHMGTLCELTVDKYKISREEQDDFALQSHKKAAEATKSGRFKEEIVAIFVKKGIYEDVVDTDETIRYDTSIEKLSTLKPVFCDKGTITAGNAPGLNDGAAALLLISEEMAGKLKLEPIAKIIGYATAHTDPKWFTIAPVNAVKRLLEKTSLKIEDFGLIEVNEAFAAQTLAVIKELCLDPARVNVNGGAIALGHPIGASGARILVTLIHSLRQRKMKLGLAALCLGGGGAMSMAIETL